MRNVLTVLAILGMLLLAAPPAIADWIDGDGHKMHWPQHPDPFGWDIDMTNYTLADDWQCSESGPVSDIHFWYSVESQTSPVPPPHILAVNVSIHDDLAATDPGNNYGYSMPNNLLWSRTFTAFAVAGPWQGPQGWDDPQPDTTSREDDHMWYWQVNLTDIAQPFHQKEGDIYWLDLNVQIPGDHLVGWKTTTATDRWNDSAVYFNPAGGAAVASWLPVKVCADNNEVDFAFVITPEPSSFVLAAMALSGLLVLAWRRRRRKV